MKKYNVPNYVRYKKDVIACQPDEEMEYEELTETQLCYKFLPLVENIGRKFATTQQASGVMSINDIIQEGNLNLTISSYLVYSCHVLPSGIDSFISSLYRI